MTALLIFGAGFVLIAAGLTARFYYNRLVDELLAFEIRTIERERLRQRVAGLEANVNARWRG